MSHPQRFIGRLREHLPPELTLSKVALFGPQDRPVYQLKPRGTGWFFRGLRERVAPHYGVISSVETTEGTLICVDLSACPPNYKRKILAIIAEYRRQNPDARIEARE